MNLPTPDSSVYAKAFPFPHYIVDDVFPSRTLRYLLQCWPKKHDEMQQHADQIMKAHTNSENGMGPTIASFIKAYFQSQKFVAWLQELTGITGIVMDPGLGEGGLHETFPPGRLMVHTDYTKSRFTGLQRRINVILYLNENWKPEYNGYLDLYDRKPTLEGAACVSIAPLFNRLVVFNTDLKSWHGHPKPLACPKGMSRKSIALYYFTLPQEGSVNQLTTFINTDSFFKRIINKIRL